MQTVTLENIGNLPLALPGMAQGTNPVISNGSFVPNTTQATACAVVAASASTPGTLAPGHTCDLTITFSPKSGGTQSGTLVLTDNSLNGSPTAFTSQTIPLSGTASASLPDITWASPAAIAAGTALSAAQLNATANAAGTFSYNPAAGTVLGVGTHTLSVTFTPTNTTSFTTASATVTLTVASPATLNSPWPSSTLAGPEVTFSWTAPAGAPGTALWIGSTGVGSNDLYSTGVHTTTSADVADLPTNGKTIYVRLWTSFGGTLVFMDYTCTAATRRQ